MRLREASLFRLAQCPAPFRVDTFPGFEVKLAQRRFGVCLQRCKLFDVVEAAFVPLVHPMWECQTAVNPKQLRFLTLTAPAVCHPATHDVLRPSLKDADMRRAVFCPCVLFAGLLEAEPVRLFVAIENIVRALPVEVEC